MSRQAWRWPTKCFSSAVSPRTRPQISSLRFELNSIRNCAGAYDVELGTLSLTRQPFAGPRVNFWLSTGNIGKERAIELVGRVRHTIHTVSAGAIALASDQPLSDLD